MTFLCLTSMFSGRKTRWGMENALISSQQAIHVGSASPAGLQGPLLPATGSFCHWAHQAGQKEALPRWNQCPHSAQHCLFFFFFPQSSIPWHQLLLPAGPSILSACSYHKHTGAGTVFLLWAQREPARCCPAHWITPAVKLWQELRLAWLKCKWKDVSV